MFPKSRFVFILVGFALLAAACGDDNDSGTIQLGQEALSPDLEDVQSDSDGDTIHGITFTTFDGEIRSFDDHAGQPLVINFFAAWCPPCAAELPDFQAVFEELDGTVDFVGLSEDPEPQASIDLLAATGVTYEIGWDEDGSLFEELGGFAMPTTIFVDASGNIVDTWAGALTADALRDLIEGII